MSFGGSVVGLDFTAVLLMAAAKGVDSPLLAHALPDVELIVAAACQKE